MNTEQRKLAFKFALDPTRTQQYLLHRWAGVSRKVYNYALAAKLDTEQQRRAAVKALLPRHPTSRCGMDAITSARQDPSGAGTSRSADQPAQRIASAAQASS